MEPYFTTKLGKLYHADCMDMLLDMDADSVDLTLTDPPYGLGMSRSANRRNNQRPKVTKKNPNGTFIPRKDYGDMDWDDAPPSTECFHQIQRVSKNAVIFGGNYFTLPPSKSWIVWDKDNGTNHFADCAWTSFNTPVRMVKYRWNGMLQGNLSATSIEKEKRIHPTQKPVFVMRWILERYAKEGDTIADFFFGGGTTAMACEMLGFNWIGIEREEKYCEAAAARLSQPIQKGLVA